MLLGMVEYMQHLEQRQLRSRYINEVYGTLMRVQRDMGPLHDLTACELEEWWESLNVSAGTRNVYLAHLAGFYRWAIRTRKRDEDPTALLVRPRQPRHLPRPIADDRLRYALREAEPPLDAWLALAAYMGLRAHEIAMLCGDDLEGGSLLVRDGKGGRQRVLPLHHEVLRRLGTVDRGPLWTNTRGGVLTANTVSHRANRYLHDLGIPETLHQLRHWFGTNVYRTSRDLRLTQELCGHASPVTTAGYAAWDPSAAAAVVGRLRVD